MNNYEEISPVILPEESFECDYIIASYFYISKSDEDIYEKAKSFAVGQTIGTWVPVPGITAEMKKRYGGKVVSIYDIPPAELTTDVPEETYHIIQIAFPDENFLPQIPMLMTTLLGNDVSTSAQVKLVDIKFSGNFLKYFMGPKFGIDGIYDYMGLNSQRRPLVLNMIKPCLGYSASEGASIFKQIAMGGVDIIKDDELFANTSYSSIKDRVSLYKKAAKEVYEHTGHLTRYCVNITDRFDKVLEHAKIATEEGADFLMINFVATGISVLQALSEMDYIKIPIVAHYATAGSMTESPFTGISTPLLLGKLARMSGADMCMFSSPYSTYPFLKRRYKQIADMQRLPFGNLKPTMPVIGGGVHPNSAKKIVSELGKEIVLASGGAILGHPMGPTEGAKSMMQAADALGKGLSLEEVAKQKGYEALKASIEKWK
ncbi:MAG: RuBisCO large subunit C-terminal-like domain-containing protein [Actinomycetota bacterium]|nr:RuBisCO large subunit C-terminal-like domain-containing protein [Actinomycetota bacterium]